MKGYNINYGAASSKSKRIEKLSFVLLQEIKFIHTLLAELIGQTLVLPKREENQVIEDKVAHALVALLQGVSSSANTIYYLSESSGDHTRDCYGIARSIFETSLNACYIIAGGNLVASKALNHAQAKMIKDLRRESKIGDSIIKVSYSGLSDLVIPPELQQEIRKFETQKGKEKPWTDLSVDERILFIGNRLEERIVNILHLVRFTIYRHSSEILHGSVFGCKYFMGLTEPIKKKTTSNGIKKSIAQQHELIQLCCIFSLSSIVECFNHVYGFNNLNSLNKEILSGLDNNDYNEDDLVIPIVKK